MSKKTFKTDEQLKQSLSREQYNVTQLKGTEQPHSGKFNKFNKDGIYQCICCGEPLFDSAAKYDPGCGWPSFWEGKNEHAIIEEADQSLGMARTEITCANCGAHLGHVFPDGPKPTGLRYCVNSASLDFVDNNNKKTD